MLERAKEVCLNRLNIMVGLWPTLSVPMPVELSSSGAVKVRFHPAAEAELRGAARYYEDRVPGSGANLWRKSSGSVHD